MKSPVTSHFSPAGTVNGTQTAAPYGVPGTSSVFSLAKPLARTAGKGDYRESRRHRTGTRPAGLPHFPLATAFETEVSVVLVAGLTAVACKRSIILDRGLGCSLVVLRCRRLGERNQGCRQRYRNKILFLPFCLLVNFPQEGLSLILVRESRRVSIRRLRMTWPIRHAFVPCQTCKSGSFFLVDAVLLLRSLVLNSLVASPMPPIRVRSYLLENVECDLNRTRHSCACGVYGDRVVSERDPLTHADFHGRLPRARRWYGLQG